jgi:hypothetical protein
MNGFVQDIADELADNWPAFVYIAMSIVFSIFFFRQRRAETRLVRQIGEGIQENIAARLDRLESLIRKSAETPPLETQSPRERGRATFSS